MISLVPIRSTVRQERRRDILRRRMAVRPLSVLIVDENAEDRQRLMNMLQSNVSRSVAPSRMRNAGPAVVAWIDRAEAPSEFAEISIRECGSGLAALEILRSQRIDVVLTDRLLPDMPGVDLIAAAAEMSHDTAVILTSRASNAPDAAAAMKSGARDYLSKRDLTAETLHCAVREAVRSARLEDQVSRQNRRLQRSSQRVGRFVQAAEAKLDASTEQAETALQEMKQPSHQPLRDLTSHFHRVENSLRESRQFLADLTRLCERAGLVK